MLTRIVQLKTIVVQFKPDEGGEVRLASRADVDRDAGGPLRGIEEGELGEDRFVGANRCAGHLRRAVLLRVSGGSHDRDGEVAAAPAVKDLAALIRQTDAVVQRVRRITVGRV